jgi:hypothetical protein
MSLLGACLYLTSACRRESNHPYTRWASANEGLEEIGCIYSAQGMEFDYIWRKIRILEGASTSLQGRHEWRCEQPAHQQMNLLVQVQRQLCIR